MVPEAMAHACHLRGRGRQLSLSRRRLTYERSWLAVLLGVWALGGLGYYCLEIGVRGLTNGEILVPLAALPFVLMLLRRGFTGSRSKRQLWVDVPAGKLVLANGTEHALAELGALSIEKRYEARTRNSLPMYSYELTAQSLGKLFSAYFEGETKRRLDALDAAVLQSGLRKLLERPQVDSVFRAAPQLASEAHAGAGTLERALAGLRALADDDHDPAIREHAKSLAAVLRSQQTA